VFNNQYYGKKVLITGHTGFKGSWLTTWLLELGATVVGVSKDIPTTPSMFAVLGLENKIKHCIQDIRELEKFESIIATESPDFVFHLAAQAIVSTSYADPLDTITTNVLGTTNVLEALKRVNPNCIAIIITSDKCYENVEQVWGYKENDPMGGKDIYSSSKGAAELIIKSYIHSFFNDDSTNIKLGVCRAGNVIGGGDWASDRIVVDCVKAWSKDEIVEIRSPNATRPWQHVLEPLSGYLALGQKLAENADMHGEAFNFGPRAEQNRTVLELLKDLSEGWDIKQAYEITENKPFHEAGLLKLNCDKALSIMKWQATMNYQQTVQYTGRWYLDYYQGVATMYDKTVQQIEDYQRLAKKQQALWTV
jgi:CDP-glucose 4,6-dehydratase